MAKSSGSTRRRRERRPTSYTSASASYDALVDRTGELWNSFSSDEKTAVNAYTGSSYTNINKDLKMGITPSSQIVQKRIDDITSAIEKSSYDKDMFLYRGVKNESSVFGFSVSKASLEQLQQIKGKTFKMNQFGSFAASSDSKGIYNNARIVLTAPKGTKMLYVEPFSKNGVSTSPYNQGASWDGTRQKVLWHGENEVLLQRGTSYKVYQVAQRDGKNIIFARIVKQDKH